jgi:hypothetical protein
MADVNGPDPQLFLPPGLRPQWAVLPRVSLYTLLAAGLLIGAGAGLTVAGFVAGHHGLRWGFPAGLAAAWAFRLALAAAERRRLADLRAHAEPRGATDRQP